MTQHQDPQYHAGETVELSPENVQNFKSRFRRYQNNVRSSPQRRRHLERTARLISDERINLSLGRGSHASRPGRLRTFNIQISEQEQPQPYTDLDDEIWHLHYQETVLFHEIGHVLFTDFQYLEKATEHMSGQKDERIRQVSNAIEDAYLESYLPVRFDCYEDLTVMNANLGLALKEEIDRYEFWQAIQTGILDNGFFDTGRWEEIYEGDVTVEGFDRIRDLAPAIEYMTERALHTHDGSERIDLAIEFVEMIEDMFDWTHDPREDATRVREDDDQMSGGQIAEMSDGSEPASAEMHDGEIDGTQGSGDVEVEQREEDLNRQKENLNRRLRRGTTKEIEQLEEMVDPGVGAGSGDLSGEIKIPNWDIQNTRNKKDAIRAGENLAPTFRRSLRRRRKSDTKYGQKRGSLDSATVARVAAGNDRIFKTQDSPEDPDYNCVIVLDRSGSMDGGDIRSAQKAVGALSVGLYDADIDVSVVSYGGDYHFLELPFGADPRERVNNLFSEKTTGGTPSTQALKIALESVDTGSNRHDFVIFITDGKPKNAWEFENVLRGADIPVCGIRIGTRSSNVDKSLYHEYVRCRSPGDVFEEMREFSEQLIIE